VAGWPISEPRDRGVEEGINIVYGWHKRNALFVFNDVGLYLDEKLSYSRELDERYQPTDKIDNKSRFHIMDCERYAIGEFGPERAVGGNQLVQVKRYWNENPGWSGGERPLDRLRGRV